jgi:O-antigen/teichoic acid export membrane protein
MPISTRLYSPEDFSAAAVFAALVGILSVSACLRFDMALALPEHDGEAASLLILALGLALIAGALCAAVLALLPTAWLALLGEPTLLPWLWLLPVGVTAGGAYQALQMWFVRRSGFKAIAFSRVAQSSGAATAQIGFGLVRGGPLGLIIGQLLNFGGAALWLGVSALLRDGALFRAIRLSQLRAAFSTHRRFPLYSTWEALANAASIQAPILLIAALAEGPEAGYLTLAIFLLQVPMALLGNAIGQVYLAGAPAAHNEGRLAQYTGDTLKALVRASALPLAFLAIVSPSAFGLVFGAPWTRAGVLVAWMVPWFFVQFVTSPISTALHVVGGQRQAMVLQIAGCVFRVAAVIIAAAIVPARIAEAYAVSGVLFYGIYFATIMRLVRLRRVDAREALARGLVLAGVGAGAGMLCATVLSIGSI